MCSTQTSFRHALKIVISVWRQDARLSYCLRNESRLKQHACNDREVYSSQYGVACVEKLILERAVE